ncbi:uncharacterized protein A1O9_02679 [Exophiala aquamarina CBS 119918]|uniref:C2H2-type domain-containing protein n=1 Tax=Exophiala aquamarina CBS 119918 TaxID=1182545 RepID=A0A072PLY5_9EURO|nr:uncharacterized protein A1O9_02679 [Exophiala aquamarina CBS 119918]KEF61114.1 hypothetical protein A1O9_02679 [Exophiala aquamarina CBS 119918]
MSEIERDGIPHHLIDFIGLEEKPWTVAKFVKESCCIIDQIRSRGKLPILVGGTHYYTHALLFKDATLTVDAARDGKSDASDDDQEKQWPVLSQPTEVILSKLREVDPEMANRWHPHDRRKIQRSLEIWLASGRRASEIYAEQHRHRQSAKESREPGILDDTEMNAEGLRFPTLLLWLEAQDSVLKDRLNRRVDAMVQDGLVEEARGLVQLKDKLSKDGIPVDTAKGIWVSIGYKEMEPCLNDQESKADANRQSRMMQEAFESVKAGTRRYAKRQNRYIRIRLADALRDARQLDKLFLLDSTSLDQWESMVSSPSEYLVDSFLQGEQLPTPSSLSPFAKQILETLHGDKNGSQRLARTCEVCQKTLMTDKEWQGHLSSRGHKKVLASQRKHASSPRTESSMSPKLLRSSDPD